MTPIELEASLLLQGSPARKGFPLTYDISRAHAIEALCRALERREAFKQEVSDAVEDADERCGHDAIRRAFVQGALGRFILPKPDPLIEVFEEFSSTPGSSNFCSTVERVAAFRNALAERGLKIVEYGDAM